MRKNLFNVIFALIIFIIIILVVLSFDNLACYLFGGISQINPKGEYFKIILQIIGGVILLLGAYYSLRIGSAMKDNNELVEKGNIAERFKNAISMLDSENSSTCIGGIYALDNIANDNKEYREQVFNILVIFINNKTKNLPSWKDLQAEERFVTCPTIEIQTIVKLLFSQNKHIYKKFKARIENAKLYGADFKDYNFSRCTFINVEFQNSYFCRSWFMECEILYTDFTFSDFANARLTGSDIMESIFSNSGFTWTRFIGCRIQSTEFICSRFHEVYFDGVNIGTSSFNGSYFTTFNKRGTFNGASFDSTTSKGLRCSNGIEARGARFGAGIFGSQFQPSIKSLIGNKMVFNGENLAEILPEEEFKRFDYIYESLLKPDWELVKKMNRTTILEVNVKCATGWKFGDTSEFTKKDYRAVLKLYKDDLKKINVE